MVAALSDVPKALLLLPSLFSMRTCSSSRVPGTWIWIAETEHQTFVAENKHMVGTTTADESNISIGSFVRTRNTTFDPLSNFPNDCFRNSYEWSIPRSRRSHSVASTTPIYHLYDKIQYIWSLLRGLCLFFMKGLKDIIRASLHNYQSILIQYPAITTSLTAGVVALAGDLLAQLVEPSMLSQKRKDEDRPKIEVRRSLTIAAEGIFVSGPFLHYAYDYMETCILSLAVNAWIRSLFQVILDIIVLDTILTGTFMITSGLLQGRKNKIIAEMKSDYLPAVRVAWLSSLGMAPIQLVNFRFVPLRFRVLVTNFQDVLWNAAVSYMTHRSRI